MHGLYRRAHRRGRFLCYLVLIGSIALATVPGAALAKDRPKSERGRGKRYVLPVAKKHAAKHKLDDRHHDYPAWDLPVPAYTAVRSVTRGRVTGVTRWGGCGRGVIIRGRDGYEYTYCHGSKITTKRRAHVRAGERIMLSGNTGHSTGPHLHFQIQGPRGLLICPQPLLRRWARGAQVGPRASTPRGCAYSPDRLTYRPRPAPPRARRVSPGPPRGAMERPNDKRGERGAGRDGNRGGRDEPGRDRNGSRKHRSGERGNKHGSAERGTKHRTGERGGKLARLRQRFRQRLRKARRNGHRKLRHRLDRHLRKRERALKQRLRRRERRSDRLRRERAHQAQLALERRVRPLV